MTFGLESGPDGIETVTAFKTGDHMDEVGASRAGAGSPDHWGYALGAPSEEDFFGK